MAIEFIALSQSNPKTHLSSEAEATEERRLSAVRCSTMLGTGTGKDICSIHDILPQIRPQPTNLGDDSLIPMFKFY
jgi:hypothetical protein